MSKIILRSVCLGIASVAFATFVAGFVALSLAAMSTPSSTSDQQVGWDLVTIWHPLPLWAWLVPLPAFGIGFGIGFLYFSRREKRHATPL